MACLLHTVTSMFCILGFICMTHAAINEYYNYQPEYQSRLLHDLLGAYHKGVPPTHEGPINVDMSFSLTSFDFVDEANFLASVRGWSFQTWTDPRLRWDPENYNGTKKVTMELDDVWVPDIELYNGVSVTETTDTKAIVSYKGVISRVPVYLITFKCNMDLYYFPYDEQRCYLKFGSWHYHSETINLTASEYFDLGHYQDSGDFKLIESDVRRHAVIYACCKETYIDVTYYMTVQRIPGAYRAKLVMPSVLTGFLILATFLLPTGSQEKITLCSILFLCLLLLLTYLHDIIPNSGDTIVGEVLAFALAMDFIATILAVISYRLNAAAGSRSSPEPGIVNGMELDGDNNDLRLQRPKGHRTTELLRYFDIGCFVFFFIVFVIGWAILLGRRS